ncbi:EAL domain-containing protein [Sinorhizobium meliloti]|nr:EAL domain-containing protein [Sinorhizobium meliloti]
MSHDPLFNATAVLYAVAGSIITMMLFGRALGREGTARTMWSVLTGIIGGSTIWTSHFISLLGLETADQQLFFLSSSIAALLISMALCAIGFVSASRGRRGINVELGGACLGLAFAANHVIGICALQMVGFRPFDYARLGLAVLLAICFGILATKSRVRSATKFCKYTAVAAMAAGIMTVHAIGVSELQITDGTPWRSMMFDIGIPDRYLFIMVLFFGSMTLAIGGVVFMIDRQSAMDRVQALEYLAFHDQLTGLPNRAYFEDRLKAATSMIAPRVAIVSVDLNRFKNINDVHGHQAGNHVLKVVAERLKAVVGVDELLCRTGGDEFIGLKSHIRSHKDAAAFATRMRDAVIGEIDWEGNRVSVGSSIGVALLPEHGRAADDLMVKADLAVYRARRSGAQQPIFYDASLDEPNRAKSIISIEMRHAMENDQFELFYQRQNRIEDSGLVGYEVLLRWNHPERGYISPEVFIPVAERDGYINEIGEWVLRRACKEAAAWSSPTKIAVNVAARQLAGGDLPSIVRSALEESGLEASRLEIEITESGIISDYDQALKIVKELKALGVSIAMDDFGTGYSSLSTLQSFPFDKIKIDQSFVRDITQNPQSAEIVRSTVLLGRNLKIDVLAEGVETKEQLEFLKSIGCGQGQGFLFGRPIPSQLFKADPPSNVLPFRKRADH